MANAKICSTLLIKYARNVIIHSQTEENISSNQAAVPECPNRRRIQRTQRGMGGGACAETAGDCEQDKRRKKDDRKTCGLYNVG